LKPSIEQEIAAARSAGANHPENLPFLLRPEKSNGQGVLLVHGFCATPREMRPLGNDLVTRGFTVLGVRLPGHGTSPKDLAKCRFEDWLTAINNGYHILVQENLAVSAAGLSTGALLVAKFSRQHPIERMVLLSPFLQLQHPLADHAGILSLFMPYRKRRIAEAEQPFYYRYRPLKGVVQINRLRRQVRRELKAMTNPTLVLASAGDKTIAPGTAEELFNKLGSEIKEFYCYGPEVPHTLTAAENPRQMAVIQRIARFLAPLPTTATT